jgi:hypothetical protein
MKLWSHCKDKFKEQIEFQEMSNDSGRRFFGTLRNPASGHILNSVEVDTVGWYPRSEMLDPFSVKTKEENSGHGKLKAVYPYCRLIFRILLLSVSAT